MQHAQIVSFPMPTGVSWLINCLLELGVRTTIDGAYWRREPKGHRLWPDHALDYLRWQLPALHRQRHFQFEAGTEIFWEHLLSFAQYPARKTILFVRDLRDAAYSEFRRRVHAGVYQDREADLLNFLQSPEIWRNSLAFLFDLPPADSLAYFNLCWMHQVPPEHLLVLRFEDSKRDPLGQLQRVLDFLGLARSQTDLLQALAHSELQHFQSIRQKLEAASGERKLTSRAGRIGEWKSALSPAALACFRGPAEQALASLGYEPLPAEVTTAVQAPEQSVLRQHFSPLLAEFHALMAQAQPQAAEALLMDALPEQAPDRQALLAGQWLALLRTRAVLQNHQLHLPSAARMTRFFSAMNSRFGHWPQIQQAARKILDPGHALRFCWPGWPLFFQPDTDFATAGRAALASAQPLFLWLQAGLYLDNSGFSQLCALLNSSHPEADAAIPVFEATVTVREGLPARAWAAHAHWGAEFERTQVQDLPACIVFRTSSLAGLKLEQPASWIHSLCVYRLPGVLVGDATH